MAWQAVGQRNEGAQTKGTGLLHAADRGRDAGRSEPGSLSGMASVPEEGALPEGEKPEARHL